MSELKLDEEFDFGFSALSDEEVALQNTAMLSAQEYKKKLSDLYKMILPLLNNLAKDAETKPNIYWPNRTEKINEFKARIDTIMLEAGEIPIKNK